MITTKQIELTARKYLRELRKEAIRENRDYFSRCPRCLCEPCECATTRRRSVSIKMERS